MIYNLAIKIKHCDMEKASGLPVANAVNGIAHRGRSRCSGRASAAGTQMKWRVPRRCQEAAREPTRRVGRCRCPRVRVQAGSGTPLGAAPLPGSAAAPQGQPPAAHLCSILPHFGRPFSRKRNRK